MAVRLSALRTSLTLLPRNIIILMFLVFISVRGTNNIRRVYRTDNIFITSKFIALCMSYLNFIIMARLFNICCRFEVKNAQNNGHFTVKECRAMMK
jgi:hypothetical protein